VAAVGEDKLVNWICKPKRFSPRLDISHNALGAAHLLLCRSQHAMRVVAYAVSHSLRPQRYSCNAAVHTSCDWLHQKCETIHILTKICNSDVCKIQKVESSKERQRFQGSLSVCLFIKHIQTFVCRPADFLSPISSRGVTHRFSAQPFYSSVSITAIKHRSD